MDRSPARLTVADLERLRDVARADREFMFERNPNWRAYRDRMLCVALCQGAALHYINGASGIKDFDVWTFFARSPARAHPDPALFRRRRAADFGASRFGRTTSAPAWIRGRRIDLLARSLD